MDPTTVIIVMCLGFIWFMFFLGRYVTKEWPFNENQPIKEAKE